MTFHSTRVAVCAFAFCLGLDCISARAAEPEVRKDVVFGKTDGQELKLDFVRPAGVGPYPLVVFVHSGGWRGGSRAEFADTQLRLSGLGLSSASVDFRAVPVSKFPAPLDDIAAALRFLAHEKDAFRINPNQMALVGTSSGGQLALLAGFWPSDDYRVRLVVNLCGPTDLRVVTGPATSLVQELLGSTDKQNAIYAEASPITAIRPNGPAVLSVHGTADPYVPMASVEAFHEALRKAGAWEKLVKVEGGGHHFQNWPHLDQTLATVASHLLDKLQPPPPVDDESVREAPRVLRPAETNVGQLVRDAKFVDLAGKSGKLSDYKSSKLVVVAMTDVGCPLCQKYGPTLARLEREFQARGVSFLFVDPLASDLPDAFQSKVAERKFLGRAALDRAGELREALQATSTTEVFVLDSARTIVYRGAVDDQYGFGYSLDRPRCRYLASALDRLLDGRSPTVTATTAPGCELATKPGPPRPLTYHGRIERIVQTNCVECHRSNGIAPFALDSYEKLTERREVLKRVVTKGLMPPWFAAHGAAGEHSPWANDRSLGEVDRQDLLTWLAGDLKRGDPAEAPLPRVYPDGWTIGKPDAIVQLPQPIAVKAEGTMPYRDVNIPTSFNEYRWVQAIEVQPSARAVVHHVLVFAVEADRKSHEPDGFFAVYVPGNSALVYPEGFAKKLPRGATLRFQMHFTPNGTATTDQTRLAMIFAKEPPLHEVRVAEISNKKFAIPPGANHYEVESATPPLSGSEHVLAFFPHMHLRGEAARYELESATGSRRTLLDVPHYDFNWQLSYRYAEPLRVPPGSKLRYASWYDNSERNPANPDAKQTVRWGPQTTDEMHLGYVEYYRE